MLLYRMNFFKNKYVDKYSIDREHMWGIIADARLEILRKGGIQECRELRGHLYLLARDAAQVSENSLEAS